MFGFPIQLRDNTWKLQSSDRCHFWFSRSPDTLLLTLAVLFIFADRVEQHGPVLGLHARDAAVVGQTVAFAAGQPTLGFHGCDARNGEPPAGADSVKHEFRHHQSPTLREPTDATTHRARICCEQQEACWGCLEYLCTYLEGECMLLHASGVADRFRVRDMHILWTFAEFPFSVWPVETDLAAK